MKNFICFSVLFCLFCNGVEMITEAQMKTTAKVVQGVCQRQSKASKDSIEKIHSGEFADDPKLKCYLKCVMEKFMLMKDGRMNYDTAAEQVKKLPEKYVGPVTKVLDTCRNSAKSSDACEAAYEAAKCMHESNPEMYMLP